MKDTITKEEIIQIPQEELRSALVLECLTDYLKGVRIPLESLSFNNNESRLGEECLKALGK